MVERRLLLLILEGGSAGVIGWVSNGIRFPWKIANIIEEILDISDGIVVTFSHVPREINWDTDILAKRGVLRAQW